MDKIKKMFKLDTKGADFLQEQDQIKHMFDPDGGITHMQGYQAMREFYSSTMLKTGTNQKWMFYPTGREPHN